MIWRDMNSEERRAAWRTACSMCMGTDCEAACRQGQCYAEEMQRRQEAEWNAEQQRGEDEYWRRRAEEEGQA